MAVYDIFGICLVELCDKKDRNLFLFYFLKKFRKRKWIKFGEFRCRQKSKMTTTTLIPK